MAVGSFSAGLSGLDANSVYLRVIGNNLANLNTVGYKSSHVNFSDLVSQTIGGSGLNPVQVGLGVVTGSISPSFSQGAIENTHEATNAAIQGTGFYVIQSSAGTTYTRAGNFSLDTSGKLVTPEGFRVQGYTQTNGAGAIVTTGRPADISVPPGVLRAPVASLSFETTTNLDARSAAAASYVTSVQVYDALGTDHQLTITYTKTGAGAWNYKITTPGEDVTGGTAGTPFSLKTGTLTFASNGRLSQVDGAAPANLTITTPTWTDGAAASTISWKLLDANGVASLTGFASTSAPSSVSQDGSAPGQIISMSINPDGQIIATFGAGQTVAIGQIALAVFNNPQGLVRTGGNQFAQSQAAGIPNVGVPGTGGRGTLIGGALEQSNVDIAQAFTAMIAAQRGYQANAKTITVSDELLVDTVNLKR